MFSYVSVPGIHRASHGVAQFLATVVAIASLILLAGCGDDVTIDTPAQSTTASGGGGGATTTLVPRYVYTANNGSLNITGYTIDQSTGALTEISGSPFATGGSTPRSLAADPEGRYLYVASATAGAIDVFAIDPGTGALTTVAGSPFAPNPANNLFGVAVAPDGEHIYVTHSTAATVSAYAVDLSSGALTDLGTALLTGTGPEGIAIDPTGQFLYTGDRLSTTTVSAHTVDATTGALADAGTGTTDTGPTALAVEPSGAYLHVTTSADNITSHAIDPNTGALGVLMGPTATGATSTPKGLAIDPMGNYLFSANSGTGDIGRFLLDGAGGMTFLGNTVAGNGAWAVAVAQNGEWVYVANSTAGTVSAYGLDPATGGLLSLGVDVAAGTQPQSIAVAAIRE